MDLREDSGQAEAINKGLRIAVGKYAGWLNSDDRLLPGALAGIHAYLKPGRVTFGWTIAEDGNGEEMWRHRPRKMNLRRLLLRKEGLPQPSVYFARQDAIRVGLLREDLRYCLDYELWIRFGLAGIRFRAVKKFLSVQVCHDKCKSREGSTLFERFRPEEQRVRQRPHGRPPRRDRAVR